MKNERTKKKKLVQKFEVYCKVERVLKIVLQYNFLYCREEGLRAGSVLQYTGLYCREEG